MRIRLDLKQAFLLILPFIGVWVSINVLAWVMESRGGSISPASSSSSVQSSLSQIEQIKTLRVIASPVLGRTPLSWIEINGSVSGAKIKVVATTQDPTSMDHGDFQGVGFIVVSKKHGELLTGNYFESEWIGNGKKVLSPSRSSGLLLPGQRRIYEYDLVDIPVSNNYVAEKGFYPSGIQHFNLLRELQSSKLRLGFYTSEPYFGVIESVEITYFGTGTILLSK